MAAILGIVAPFATAIIIVLSAFYFSGKKREQANDIKKMELQKQILELENKKQEAQLQLLEAENKKLDRELEAK
jgi:hypothetical protein